MTPEQHNHVERNKNLARKFFDEAFNKGNLSVVDEVLSPSYTFDGAPQSQAQVKGWVTSLRTQFPNLHFTLQAILGEGETVALRWQMTGTTPAGDQIVSSGTNIATFDADGKCLTNMQNGKATMTVPGQPPVVHTDQCIYSMG